MSRWGQYDGSEHHPWEVEQAFGFLPLPARVGLSLKVVRR
jgi:hypothetical protein